MQYLVRCRSMCGCVILYTMYVVRVGYWTVTQRSIPVFAEPFIFDDMRRRHSRSTLCQFGVGRWRAELRVSADYHWQCQRHWRRAAGNGRFTVTFSRWRGRNWRGRAGSFWPRPRQRNRHRADRDALEVYTPYSMLVVFLIVTYSLAFCIVGAAGCTHMCRDCHVLAKPLS